MSRHGEDDTPAEVLAADREVQVEAIILTEVRALLDGRQRAEIDGAALVQRLSSLSVSSVEWIFGLDRLIRAGRLSVTTIFEVLS